MAVLPTTSSLGCIQKFFFDALTAPRAVAEEDVNRHLKGNNRLSSQAGLAIYQRSYILRLTRCLEEQFPALVAALGQGLFQEFAHQYLAAIPSTHYSLHMLGKKFADWFEEERPDREEIDHRQSWIDFLIDLTRYERALFTMAEAPGTEGDSKLSVEVDDKELALHPSILLMSFSYPVAWFHDQVRQGLSPPLPSRTVSHVAILRNDFRTKTFPIHEIHLRFLSELSDGSSIAQALGVISQSTGQPPGDVQQSFEARVRNQWIRSGFFTRRANDR